MLKPRPLAAAMVVIVVVVVVFIVEFATGSTPARPRSSQNASTHGDGRQEGPSRPRRGAHRRTSPSRPSAARELGEMVVSRLTGTTASAELLDRIHAGHVGGVILFAENFALGDARAAATIAELQHAARAAGTWPLLIMTDQEGGEVRRIADAPPKFAPREMASAAVAYGEGLAAGAALKRIGVNVDLAPVADVNVFGTSFLGARSFGPSAKVVAERACAFADGLIKAGIAYTLKHFPGLGTATTSTDNAPVTVETPASILRANYAAYRQCGRGPRALVMVSSAGYPTLTGTATPAVLTPKIYGREMTRARIHAVTISDDLQAAALAEAVHPALHAINAGLDLLLYAQTEAASAEAYGKLKADLESGALSAQRVSEASTKIGRLKAELTG
jgi:beta-N-acetylhexosaminidase